MNTTMNTINIPTNDIDVISLLNYSNNTDDRMLQKYNELIDSCSRNIHLKDVLKEYKKYFELKLEEKMAQEKALLILIEHLDNVIGDEELNKEQSSHIDSQKEDIFRELISVQDIIDSLNKTI